MVRKRALKIVVPLVALLFVAAFAKHRLIDGKIQQAGTLKSKDMDETSGIAASAVNPGLYYVHNDSGDSSRFFAITESGELKSTIKFKGDAKEPLGVRDCEDIAVGPGPVKRKSYVYLGDIGDNSANRKFITIYRFAESKQWKNAGKTEATPAVINLRYPDGAWDAESLAIDPLDKLIYIITKRGDSVRVYTSPLVPPAGDTVTLTFRARLFFAGLKPFKWITAADISPDGKHFLVRSYEKVYYWQRRGTEPLWVTLQRVPEELPYKLERQGEAIGFTANGEGYLTTSEGLYAPIYYYKLPAQ